MQYLFGPVPSRRLGRSLGIDLTPFKTCTEDCVFCQLGRTTIKTNQRSEYVPTADVLTELGRWKQEGGTADYVTLSGMGEPTLHTRFGDIIDFVHQTMNLPVALLTNGTLLYIPEVRKMAAKADLVKTTLSAWDEESFAKLHQPAPGTSFALLIEGAKALRQIFSGTLWLEVMLVHGYNDQPSDAAKIAAIAQELKPDAIHLNTPIRPLAEGKVEKLGKDELQKLAALFGPTAEVIADFGPHGDKKKLKADKENVRELLKRHAATAEELQQLFSANTELTMILDELVKDELVRIERQDGKFFYIADPKKP